MKPGICSAIRAALAGSEQGMTRPEIIAALGDYPVGTDNLGNFLSHLMCSGMVERLGGRYDRHARYRLLRDPGERSQRSSRTVLELLYLGKDVATIGELTGLTARGVHKAISRLKDRLGCETTHGLIYAGLQRGWLKPPPVKVEA